ncbi:MAG: hypothetical protein RR994_03965, partial [Clostridia bacterium]
MADSTEQLAAKSVDEKKLSAKDNEISEREKLKEELRAELLAELKDTYIQAESMPEPAKMQQVIIAQPISEADAAEASRLSEQRKLEAEINDWLDEKVPIKLFKDGKNYKDDLTVSVNGETIRIMRGLPVKVKRKFAMLI